MSSSGPSRVLVVGGGIAGATVLTYLLDALEERPDLDQVSVDLAEMGDELGSLTSQGPAATFMPNNVPRFPRVILTEACNGVVIPSCCSAPCSFLSHASKFLGLACAIGSEKCRGSCCGKKIHGGDVTRQETVEALEELMEKHPELQPFDKHTGGVLFVIRREWYLRKLRAWRDDAAHPERLDMYDILTPAEAVAHEPCLEGEEMAGAVLSKRDGHIECEQMIAAMGEGATKRGATIRTRTRVVNIERRGDEKPIVTMINIDTGVLQIVKEYSAVIMCTGPKSAELMPEAPVHLVGGFSITGTVAESVPVPKGAIVWPEEVMYMRASGTGANPQEYRIGGLMSLTALTDMRFDTASLAFYGRARPGRAIIETGTFKTWTGARPVTVAMPVCAEVAPRIFANTGYGPNGFLWCWGASKRVAVGVVSRLAADASGVVGSQPRKLSVV